MDPISVSVDEAARLTDVSRSTIYRLMGAGEIESCHIGAARRPIVASLRAYVRRNMVPLAILLESGDGSESLRLAIVKKDGRRVVEFRVMIRGQEPATTLFPADHLPAWRRALYGPGASLVDRAWEYGVHLHRHDPAPYSSKPLPVDLFVSYGDADGSHATVRLIDRNGEPWGELEVQRGTDRERVQFDPAHLPVLCVEGQYLVSRAQEAGCDVMASVS